MKSLHRPDQSTAGVPGSLAASQPTRDASGNLLRGMRLLAIATVALATIPGPACAQKASPPAVAPGRADKAATNGSQPPSESSAVVLVDRALFRIETPSGRGSGFQFMHPGYILTNRHVVETVRLGEKVDLRPVQSKPDGSDGLGEAIPGTVRYKHPELDVAVIEIANPPSTLALRQIETTGVKYLPRGTELLAHGFPGIGSGSRPTVSRGMLSAHYDDPLSGQVFYITDTSLSPGSSGGPVTDAKGAVIGIATAVSIVVDGTGNSWGYVLPISSIETALDCKAGFAALPKPFDPSLHSTAIRAASDPLAALAAFRDGARAASRACATADELATSMGTLIDVLASTKGSITSDDIEALAKGILDAFEAPVTRLVEWTMLDANPDQVKRLADTLLWDGRIGTWSGEIIARLQEGKDPRDALISLASHLTTVARLIASLIDGTDGHCEDMRKAIAALGGDGPIDRARVRLLAGSLVPLMQARLLLDNADLSQFDTSGDALPTKARQSLRLCKAELENAQDEWEQLPGECRFATELAIRHFRGNAPSSDAAIAGTEPAPGNAAADRAQRPQAPVDEADGYTSMDAYSTVLKAEGWLQWGETRRQRAVGPAHEFTIDFDESPSILMIIGVSRDAKEILVGTSNAGLDGVDAAQERQSPHFSMQAVIARKNQLMTLGILSPTSRDFEYEFAIFYRRSAIEVMIATARRLNRDFEPIGVHLTLLPPEGRHEFTLDSTEWSQFGAYAREVNDRDVDLEIIGPDGAVVTRDFENDGAPVGLVSNATSGRFVIRLLNRSKSPACIEFAALGARRNE